jgi:gamma-butyrobetaine dioxygenase
MLPTRTLRFASHALRVGRTAVRVPDLPPLPYAWLRDACRCPECLHPQTRHRSFETGMIPEQIAPVHDGVRIEGDTLHVRWQGGHESTYMRSFLERYTIPSKLSEWHADVTQVPWDAEHLSSLPTLSIDYASLDTPSKLLEAYNQLGKYGLLLVRGVSTNKKSDSECELRNLVSKFGELRATFYGEVWDVRDKPKSKNVAYTNGRLGWHQDVV